MKDKEVYKNLLIALDQMKSDAAEYLDKKLWKEITLPQTYEELLLALSKDELQDISRHYGFRNISSLKKKDLVHYLVQQLPCRITQELKLMDEHRYLFLKQFVSEDNKVFQAVLADNYDHKLVNYWRKTGLVLSGSSQGQKVLFMPSELQDVFQTLEHDAALQSKLKQNTEWLGLTYGMLYYYGAMGHMTILAKLEELTGVRPDYQEFHTILLRGGEYYDAPRRDSYGYWAHQNVPDVDALLKEQRARAGVDYYRFSKSKLLKAGAPDYFDDTPAFQRLHDYFSTHYQMTEKEAKDLAAECQHIVNQINEPSAIFDLLKTTIEFPNVESVQHLADVIMFFWNNTRQWALKGHSPAELGTGANPGLSSQPKNLHIPFDTDLPFATPAVRPAPSGQTLGSSHSKSSNPTVIDLKTRQKIGRNDPCPCGSGKKFKHCCGGL